MTVVKLPREKISLIDVLFNSKLATNKSDARRLIRGSAIKINNEKCNDENYAFTDFKETIIQKGKSQFIKIVFNC